MKRALFLVALAVSSATPALADNATTAQPLYESHEVNAPPMDLNSNNGNAFQWKAQSMPKDCVNYSALSIDVGSSMGGGVNIQVVGGKAAISFGANITLQGPLYISVCDGRAIISGEPIDPPK